MSRHLASLVFVFGAALMAHPEAARAGVGSGSEFTAQELRQLNRGDLIQRRVVEDRGDRRFMGGTAWQVIDAPPEVLWQALLDTAHYSRMLPQVTEAHVVRDRGDTRTVFVRHGGTLIETSYYLEVALQPNRSGIKFHVDEAHAHGIRSAWGYYALRPYPGGKTLLVYGVMADIGDGIVALLLRSTVHEWMLKVPWMVKRFVEGSGRRLYHVNG
jgi:hypothetical protein